MKTILKVLFVLIVSINVCGCNSSPYPKEALEHFKSQNRTPPPINEIPKDEIHVIDGVKYRVVSMDYIQDEKNDRDRYGPEYLTIDSENKDVLNANKNELINETVPIFKSEIDEQISFGKCSNYDEAMQAAIIAIREYYKEEKQGYDCVDAEQPFYICYNSNANAYIISGTFDLTGRKPLKKWGGCVCIALEKDTGILLMLYHSA